MDAQPDPAGLKLVPDEANSVTTGPPAPPERSRPKKVLPTNRMAFAKQLDSLRGWAIAGADGRVATNQQVAEIVNLKSDTITLANSFFADIKFLLKAEGGYTPSEAVAAFNHAYAWAPDTAAHKLAGPLRRTWFGEALLPVLQLRPLSEGEALIKLGESASAGPEYRSQLGTLLDYLGAAGLIVREGGMVKMGTPDAPSTPTPTPSPVEKPEPQAEHLPPRDNAARVPQGVTTGFAQTPEGQLQFSINFRVTMSEIAGWQPDRISAFFAGVAQVLAAKAEVEKGASSS